MKLTEASVGKVYTITAICTQDEELNSFLFTLGCYPGEEIVIISQLGQNYVVTIKDSRYSINNTLAEAIIV